MFPDLLLSQYSLILTKCSVTFCVFMTFEPPNKYSLQINIVFLWVISPYRIINEVIFRKISSQYWFAEESVTFFCKIKKKASVKRVNYTFKSTSKF